MLFFLPANTLPVCVINQASQTAQTMALV